MNAAVSNNPAALVLEALAAACRLFQRSDKPGVPAVAAQELQAIELRQAGALAVPDISGDSPEAAVLNALHEVCSTIRVAVADPALSRAAEAEMERIDNRLAELEGRGAK